MIRATKQQVRFQGVEERDSELLLEFADEASEQLENIEQALLAFEQQPRRRTHLADAARGLHSLKGAAGYVALLDLQELCHRSEDLIETFPSSGDSDLKAGVDLTLDAVSVMRERLADVRQCCDTRRELRASPSADQLLRRMDQAVAERSPGARPGQALPSADSAHRGG